MRGARYAEHNTLPLVRPERRRSSPVLLQYFPQLVCPPCRTLPHGQSIRAGRFGTAVEFELDGTRYTAMNGGPHFTFNEAISFQIDCADQKKVNYYWDALTAGGEESQCG
nr:VOC family protein [Flaviflexus massiliensis]